MAVTALYIDNNESSEPAHQRIDDLLRRKNICLSDCLDLESAIRRVDSDPPHRNNVCMVIFGPQSQRPIQAARQIHRLLPDIQLLFLMDEQKADIFPELNSPISGLGSHWEVLDLSSDQFEEQLEKTLAAVEKRQKYRTTLSELNKKLQRSDKAKVSELQRYSTSLHYLSHIVDHAHDGIIATTMDGIIIRWNSSAENILHITSDQAVGHSVFSLLTGAWAVHIKQYYDNLIESGKSFYKQEVELSLDNDNFLVLELTLSLIRDDNGRKIAVAAFVRDITERKITESVLADLRKDLERMSFEDGLTGIANRRMFDNAFDKEWKRMLRYQRPLSLILIDIDHFKNYNDHYGHLAGDECLKSVAQTLQHEIRRPSDLVARYGGEEFVILLPETDEESAFTVAQRCREALRARSLPHETSPIENIVTISAGVLSTVPKDTETPEDMLECVDRLLYRAKEKGRNRVLRFSDGDNAEHTIE